MTTECDFEDYTFDQDGGVTSGPLWCRLPDGHDGPHRTTPIQCMVINLGQKETP